jgi:hypothetical protein
LRSVGEMRFAATVVLLQDEGDTLPHEDHRHLLFARGDVLRGERCTGVLHAEPDLPRRQLRVQAGDQANVRRRLLSSNAGQVLSGSAPGDQALHSQDPCLLRGLVMPSRSDVL